jgi:hypothetical protein
METWTYVMCYLSFQITYLIKYCSVYSAYVTCSKSDPLHNFVSPHSGTEQGSQCVSDPVPHGLTNFGIRVALVKLILAQIVMKFADFMNRSFHYRGHVSPPQTVAHMNPVRSSYPFYKIRVYVLIAFSYLYLGSRSALSFSCAAQVLAVCVVCCMCSC